MQKKNINKSVKIYIGTVKLFLAHGKISNVIEQICCLKICISPFLLIFDIYSFIALNTVSFIHRICCLHKKKYPQQVYFYCKLDENKNLW